MPSSQGLFYIYLDNLSLIVLSSSCHKAIYRLCSYDSVMHLYPQMKFCFKLPCALKITVIKMCREMFFLVIPWLSFNKNILYFSFLLAVFFVQFTQRLFDLVEDFERFNSEGLYLLGCVILISWLYNH